MAGHLLLGSADGDAFTLGGGVVQRDVQVIARLQVDLVVLFQVVAEDLLLAHDLNLTAEAKLVWPAWLFLADHTGRDVGKGRSAHCEQHGGRHRKCNPFFHL